MDSEPDRITVDRAQRWLPLPGLLAAAALGATGLISPPPPVAGAAAADVVAYFNNHRVGLQVESLCDGLAALLLLIFAASITARLGGTASLTAFVAVAVLAACVLQFVARVAWTVACSVTMLVRPASNPGRPASQRT